VTPSKRITKRVRAPAALLNAMFDVHVGEHEW
jgi:hypothetical protein